MTEFAVKDINPFANFGFKKLETAEIAKFTPAQIRSYEDSLKHYRDLKNSLETGKEEAREERNTEIAKEMLAVGEPIEKIIKNTGLTENK